MTRLVSLVAATALAASTAGAQARDAFAQLRAPRGAAGFNIVVASPVGGFADHVDVSGGGSANGTYYVDRRGILGLRGDIGFVVYGSERQRVRLSPTIPGRVTADLNTSYSIFTAGIGPQLMVPVGFVRPYVNAGVGLAYFGTHSSLSGQDENQQLFRTRNHSDVTLAYTSMAGLFIPVYAGQVPVAIDLGARYHGNGQAEYLPEGGITDNDDGSVTLDRVRGETNFVTYHLGVSLGLRPGRARR